MIGIIAITFPYESWEPPTKNGHDKLASCLSHKFQNRIMRNCQGYDHQVPRLLRQPRLVSCFKISLLVRPQQGDLAHSHT
jgi:hypothetical protein